MVNLKRILWHLLGGTRGGPMRIRILQALLDRPYNTNQLAVLIPEGGSIPAVADMKARLGVEPILCGFGHRDENMHAPEESFRLSSFYKGREACARIYGELAGEAAPAKASRAKAGPAPRRA